MTSVIIPEASEETAMNFTKFVIEVYRQNALMIEQLEKNTRLIEKMEQNNEELKAQVEKLEETLNNKGRMVPLPALPIPTLTQPMPMRMITPVKKPLSVKYWEKEIPEEELKGYDKEDLRKIRQNMYTAVHRYGSTGKDAEKVMSERNIKKINELLNELLKEY